MKRFRPLSAKQHASDAPCVSCWSATRLSPSGRAELEFMLPVGEWVPICAGHLKVLLHKGVLPLRESVPLSPKLKESLARTSAAVPKGKVTHWERLEPGEHWHDPHEMQVACGGMKYGDKKTRTLNQVDCPACLDVARQEKNRYHLESTTSLQQIISEMRNLMMEE